MTTMTKKLTTKPRAAKRPAAGESTATIQVRVDARLKRSAEKIFKKRGLSTSDGVRQLLARAVEEDDPWYAHKTSSHIPNAELQQLLKDSEAGIGMIRTTREELKKLWEDA